MTKLLQIAKLEAAREREFERDPEFKWNWNVVKQWKAENRYEIPGELQADELFKAVADRKHGVFRWLRQHW